VFGLPGELRRRLRRREAMLRETPPPPPVMAKARLSETGNPDGPALNGHCPAKRPELQSGVTAQPVEVRTVRSAVPASAEPAGSAPSR
jgi:hypothetical protein